MSHKVRTDSTVLWRVAVRADDLVAVVTAGGPAARLIDSGAADTGILDEACLEQGADGVLTFVAIELDEWWTNAVQAARAAVTPNSNFGGQSMNVQLRLQPFDGPLETESPCPSPVAEDDGTGMTLLTCP